MKKNETVPRDGWGFKVAVTCIVAALFIPLLMYRRERSQPTPPPEAPPAVEAAAVAPPARPARPPTEVAAQSQPVARNEMPSAVEERWGIQVASVGMALGGLAVDLRYTVVEAEKAAALASGETSIYVIDEESGTKIAMPTPSNKAKIPPRDRARMARQLGSFPPSPNSLAAGRTNSVLLPNSRQLIKSGSRLTVFVGDAQANHLVVQ